MKRIFLMAFMCAAACGPADTPSQAERPPEPISEPVPEPVQAEITEVSDNDVYENVDFQDVLDEFLALNARLESVSHKLRAANVELCPKAIRDVGFSTHMIGDYPANLQPMAQAYLGAGDRISVRAVRAGSPAELAGISSRDQVLRVNAQWIPSGPTSITLFSAMTRRAYEKPSVEFLFLRDGERHSAIVSPETLCAYPSNIFFSERVNGHTDGEEIWITSQLMRTVPDDVNLALIVAHEMGHAIAGHADQSPNKALELEADRMALIMLARAGFDIDIAVDHWQTAPRPHGAGQGSSTHPTMGERLNNFRRAQRQIKAKLSRGEALTF